jgi:hypothetical protein
VKLIGFSPAIYLGVSGCQVLRKGYTCQKRTSHHNHNTVLGGRLGIDRVGAMLYLLEGQILTPISLARIVWI